MNARDHGDPDDRGEQSDDPLTTSEVSPPPVAQAPPGGYRQPPPAETTPKSRRGPTQHLGSWPAGPLGDAELNLRLGGGFHLVVDRRNLSLKNLNYRNSNHQRSAGLAITSSRGLPTAVIYGLDVDLGTASLTLEAEGLGEATATAVSIAGRALLRQTLGLPSATETVVDRLLAGQATDRRGRRRLAAAGLGTGVWLDPATQVDLYVDREAVELAASRPISLVFLGIFGVGITAVRYLFARRRLEIDGSRGLGGLLLLPLLALVAWIATLWLRRRLPDPVGAPGYDPWADEERLDHLQEAIAALRPPGAATDPAAPASTSAIDPKVLLQRGKDAIDAALESPPGYDSACWDPATWRLFRAPLDPRSTSNNSHNSDTSLFDDPSIDSDPVPGIDVGLRHGGELRVELTALALTLHADGGLFATSAALPELAELRLHDLRLRFDGASLAVVTSPGLGALPQAALQELLRTEGLPRLPETARALLLGRAEIGSRTLGGTLDLGEGRHLTLGAPADAVAWVRHREEQTELGIRPGLALTVAGLPFSLPKITLRAISCGWDDGAVRFETTPAAGALEEAIASGLFRLFAGTPERLPALARERLGFRLREDLGLPLPPPPPTIDPAVLAGRRPVFAIDLPEVGEVEVLLDPDDPLDLRITRSCARFASSQGIVVAVERLGFTFTLHGVEVALGDGDTPRLRAIEASPPLGPLAMTALESAIQTFVEPLLAKWLPTHPDPDDGGWTLYRGAVDRLGAIEVCLPTESTLTLRRTPSQNSTKENSKKNPRLELEASAGLRIRGIDGGALPALRLDRVSWSSATWALDLDTQPPAGPAVHQLLTGLLRHLAGDHPLFERLRGALDLPAPPSQPPPPPPQGPLLLRRALGPAGAGELALARTYFAMVSVGDSGRLTATIDGGLRLRLPDLGTRIAIEELALQVPRAGAPLDLAITADPALGSLEHCLLRMVLDLALAEPVVRDQLEQLWPAAEPPADRPDFRVLATLARDVSLGPICLALAPGGALRIALDRQMLELECEAGLHIAVAGASWLPDVLLHKLTYTLADGAIDLRFSGIVERYYHEAESVSPITEAILSHILRVLVTPRLPEFLLPLGFRRFPLPPPPTTKPDQIILFNLPLGAGYGEAQVAMEADETITVTASEEEVEIRCDRGLEIALPALRFGLHARAARYHARSGEVQIGGLGQLENAIVEAVIFENIRKNLPEGIAGGAPIAGVVDRLPSDSKGNRRLYGNLAVHIRMRPDARFTLAINAGGIDVTASPPLIVDGPGVLDYELRGFTYTFARARFALSLGNDGVLANLFTGVIAETAESQINKLLRPILPPAMREPGYSLAKDPQSAENLAVLVANFRVIGKE